ncbi:MULTISPECIES: hypothetical protein [Pontibacillus]|uniref:Uncharacterized protein n=1 Tax=Pontibacillus chungwhensis TaxID=265426 RepID=A0ABY8V1Q5_9BACI|nr:MULTISPECIES: hypothetical protein [Pontibacillus]MCD5322441.1 hypothetical protein [Pontibacillus sp. HN14]WIF99727.1 hypothetical protein QNI29_08750 [Pontibacillus chungwhensis]
MESAFQLFIYLAVIMNSLIGIISFKKSQHLFVLYTGFIAIALSMALAWTFGPLVFAIGTIQVFYGIIHIQSQKATE